MTGLDEIEVEIRLSLAKLKLGDAMRSLWLLRPNSPDLKPFMIAGLSMFAMRFCPPSNVSQSIKNYNIESLIALSNSYYLNDPITFDESLQEEFKSSNPIFLVLRIVSSQFPYELGIFSDFARPFYLYHEIPRHLQGTLDIPQFDLENRFSSLNGVSVLDFITTGFVVYAASKVDFTISRDYFLKAHKHGVNLPNQKGTSKIRCLRWESLNTKSRTRAALHEFSSESFDQIVKIIMGFPLGIMQPPSAWPYAEDTEEN
jgi:hypothetical protein